MNQSVKTLSAALSGMERSTVGTFRGEYRVLSGPRRHKRFMHHIISFFESSFIMQRSRLNPRRRSCLELVLAGLGRVGLDRLHETEAGRLHGSDGVVLLLHGFLVLLLEALHELLEIGFRRLVLV